MKRDKTEKLVKFLKLFIYTCIRGMRSLSFFGSCSSTRRFGNACTFQLRPFFFAKKMKPKVREIERGQQQQGSEKRNKKQEGGNPVMRIENVTKEHGFRVMLKDANLSFLEGN